MPIYKSVQHSIYCENWHVDGDKEASCNQFTDYEEVGSRPVQHYRALGFVKIKGKWYCAKCAEKIKQQ